jgi:DNA repair ATPase RecN
MDVLAVKLETLHGDVVEVKTALERLSEAITKLALVEQQQSQTANALERAFKAIGKIEERLSALEQTAPKHGETSVWVDRFILAIMIAALGFIGSKIGLM